MSVTREQVAAAVVAFYQEKYGWVGTPVVDRVYAGTEYFDVEMHFAERDPGDGVEGLPHVLVKVETGEAVPVWRNGPEWDRLRAELADAVEV
ncbi:MAG: hypothetical protein QM809_11450 [Gordonia sp. (in: high G+C Gram-positive bacteria)]|uniref:hypothetical protein n=1 Tax=Gordonia sp. (in: high G+C Gram-positive bacteria) TaxID=84139 RepID=UPI0039E3470F